MSILAKMSLTESGRMEVCVSVSVCLCLEEDVCVCVCVCVCRLDFGKDVSYRIGENVYPLALSV